jgi:hypothetical protein
VTPTQPLTTEECDILGALVDPGADPPARTLGALAKRLDLEQRLLAGRLEELRSRSPPLAVLLPDDEWAVQAWAATAEGRRTHEERCG